MNEQGTVQRVGFIGLGQMGAPMAGHIARSDIALSVFDLRPEAADACVEAGAARAESALAAATDAEVVCVVVATDAQLLDTVSNDLIEAMAPDGIVVIHSTVGIASVRTLAHRAELLGRHAIDVGISGGEFGAQSGDLTMIAGGEEAIIDRVRPVLECYSDQIFHTGGLGTGMTVKLARNLTGYAMMAAIHDGQVLVEAAGVELGVFKQVLEATHLEWMTDYVIGRTRTLPEAAQFDRHDGAVGLVAIGHKDLAMADAAASEFGVEVPSAAVAQRHYADVIGVELEIDPELLIERR
ncbi:MAG: NAD(P)-dependent oxidoreductase [Acidobacteria bacterium]|nr:NAD(P)-dependent oxidoreductase [Acidobacteriota bacterium]